VVLHAARVRVARLVEEELCELRSRPKLAVLGTLERRRAGHLRRSVRVERSAGHGGVVHGDPARVQGKTVRVEGQLIRAVYGQLPAEGDGRVRLIRALQGLELAVREIARGLWDIAVDEAVRPLRRRPQLVRAADVLDDPDVAGRVVLDPFVAAATERAGNVCD